MTPDQFLQSLTKQAPQGVILFLGSEPFERERCRRALLKAALGDDLENNSDALTRMSLDEVPLASILDEARAMSLFAAKRVIWVSSAEAALPRGKAAASNEDGNEAADGDGTSLTNYLRDPTPDTVLVFECNRYGFDGEDKARMEKVQQFFAAIPSKVEFRAYAPESARMLAQSLAKQSGLQLGLAELALLLEATGGEPARIQIEIEKLSLYTDGKRKVTAADIAALVPDAQASNIFALVAAIGRKDRVRALELLDTLSREGTYMPLALTFLATQFRMALVAREAGARNASSIQAHFNKLGARIWPERARQIEQTVEGFTKEKLDKAIRRLFEADRGLRDTRPDDRIIMEEMIVALTT